MNAYIVVSRQRKYIKKVKLNFFSLFFGSITNLKAFLLGSWTVMYVRFVETNF